MQADTAGWAALVPWTGIQGVPSSVNGVASTNPPQSTVTVTIPPLTVGGTSGYIQFKNGVYVASRNPT